MCSRTSSARPGTPTRSPSRSTLTASSCGWRAGFRTTDKAGRNHVAVAIEPVQGGTASVVTGSLPYHAGFEDFGQATIALTARCPAEVGGRLGAADGRRRQGSFWFAPAPVPDSRSLVMRQPVRADLGRVAWTRVQFRSLPDQSAPEPPTEDRRRCRRHRRASPSRHQAAVPGAGQTGDDLHVRSLGVRGRKIQCRGNPVGGGDRPDALRPAMAR